MCITRATDAMRDAPLTSRRPLIERAAPTYDSRRALLPCALTPSMHSRARSSRPQDTSVDIWRNIRATIQAVSVRIAVTPVLPVSRISQSLIWCAEIRSVVSNCISTRSSSPRFFFGDSGTFGKTAVTTSTVHYVGAWSAYEPICSGARGMDYFTLLNAWDISAA